MYHKGALLAVAGILLLSFDVPLIRMISADSWTVIVWRGGLTAISFSLFAALHPRMRERFFRVPSAGTLLTGLLFSGSTVAFVLAAKLIPVSSVLTFVATIPLGAALLSRVFLGERLDTSLIFALIGASFGAALVARGDWAAGDPLGYGVSVLIVLCVGGYLTALRSRLKPYAPQALALSGLFASVVGLAVGGMPAVVAADIPYLLTLGLVVVPVSVALLSASTRYISASDVGMIMVLELVFGVFWAWLFLGEEMARVTAVGVTIVFLVLMLRARIASRKSEQIPEEIVVRAERAD
ncbi:DMT family transporter [Nisaea sediminum]|uniref:DMT family transporter n=1 Tax=Nisaea sediminum TaxID=2775867 RepID=UPI001866BB2A|nr:DMT family transporter [Nisaea sediminum]